MRPVTRSGRGEPDESSLNLSKQVAVVKSTVERASASREFLRALHPLPPPGCGLNTPYEVADVISRLELTRGERVARATENKT